VSTAVLRYSQPFVPVTEHPCQDLQNPDFSG
jgi:hypothetical protein